MARVLCFLARATFIGTAHPEMEERDSKRNNASCKDHEKNPNFDHGLLDDCHVLANALANPQLNQLIKDEKIDKERESLEGGKKID